MIMDKKSGVSESLINDTSNELYENFINVIPVAIGEDADTKELKLTTKDESNLIKAPKVFIPDKLGETIMRKVFKGIFSLFVCFRKHCVVCAVKVIITGIPTFNP